MCKNCNCNCNCNNNNSKVNTTIIAEGEGKPGESAYQIWLDLGNTGTEEEFLASLSEDKIPLDQKGAPDGVPFINDVALRTTIAELKSFNGVLKSNLFYLTDKDKEGPWHYDPLDTTSIEDIGTVIITADGKRIKRDYTGPAKLEWFKNNDIDDTIFVQRALDSNAKEIDFGDNTKTYTLGNINLRSNKILTGNHPTIIPKADFSGYDWFSYKPTAKFNSVATIVVEKGSKKFTTSLSANITVGDIIMMLGPESFNDGMGGAFPAIYNFGHYTQVIKKEGNDIYLANAFEESFTTLSFQLFDPIQNLSIDGLKFFTNGIENISVISVLHGVNCYFGSLELKGTNSVNGISVNGINISVSNSLINGFPKVSFNGAGYGISCSGHNIHLFHNYIYDCKHSLTAGERRYMSTGIRYEKNQCEGSILAPVDMHGNVRGSIIDNEIATSNELALIVRSGNIDIIRNTIYSSAIGSSRKAIVCFEQFDGNCRISDNKIYWTNSPTSTSFPIQFYQNTPVVINNIEIDHNYSSEGFIRIESILGKGVKITNNYLDAIVDGKNGYLDIAKDASEVLIKGNTFVNKKVAGSFNYSIAVGAQDVFSNIKIEENNFIVTDGANTALQIRTNCEGVKIKRNTFYSNNAAYLHNDISTGKRNIQFDNRRIDSANAISVYVSPNLPTASAFFEGELIYTNLAGLPTRYLCIKTGSSSYAWKNQYNDDTKENITNKSTSATPLGISDIFYPTQKQAKDYIDASVNKVRRVIVGDDYTVLPTDYIVDYQSLLTPKTVTLPLASSMPLNIVIIKDGIGKAGLFPITITITGADLIDGKTSVVINQNYGYLILFAAAGWEVIGSNNTNFIIINDVTAPTKSNLNTNYGNLKAGVLIYYPLISGGNKLYRKLSDTNNGEWEVVTPVLLT